MNTPFIEQLDLVKRPNVAMIMVHGRWGSREQFDPIIPHIAPYVGKVLAVNLPISEPGLTYEDHADVVVNEIDKLDDRFDFIVQLAHSRGPEVTVRSALKRPDRVRQNIDMCGRQPRAKGQAKASEPRMQDAYRAFEEMVGEMPKKEHFPKFWKIMCPDCTKEEAQLLFLTYRKQAPMQPTPLIEKQPSILRDHIVATNDGARRMEGQIADSRAYPGIEPIKVTGDHYLFYNQASFMGALIVSRIAQPSFIYTDPKVEAPSKALATQ